jgi:hypothetical protein
MAKCSADAVSTAVVVGVIEVVLTLAAGATLRLDR